MTGTRAGGAALCVPGVPGVPTGSGTTGGRLPQRPEAGRGASARAPELSVSQPSAGQGSGSTPQTTRLPTEPDSASRHRLGVAVVEMSVQSRPGMPTITTGCGPGARVPGASADTPEWAGLTDVRDGALVAAGLTGAPSAAVVVAMLSAAPSSSAPKSSAPKSSAPKGGTPKGSAPASVLLT